MNKIEKIQISNIKDISLLVALDSIELEKTLGYHDLFLLWSPTFQKAGIPGSLTLARSQNSQMSFMYGFFFVKFLFFTVVCVVIMI